MSILIKTSQDIKKMRAACKLAAQTLNFIKPYVKPGVNTEELNKLCNDFILKHNAIPAPLNYHGFPKCICTSINDVVCHGIPSITDVLKEGDIVNVDVTVILNGYHGDTSTMFIVGEVDQEINLLVSRTYKAMMKGIEAVKPNVFLNEIGKSIEKYVKKFNYGIVREYTGHGIGQAFHEDPHVCHYDLGKNGPRLKPGMIFTVEPMINASSVWKTVLDEDDGWTVRTKDGALSAQYEHTVLVTDTGVEILTVC